ncbi:MAG: Dot/Icm type IV secretion system ATPase DotB [Francisellaceae bacterium]|jgi:defect in organelle trafficking protein DotB|nr:Dot/Icm type IV secretion system ATPase DotB [Francisellaceae bacterium]MBT6206903.1 Dot/Icm type IV secretion system ATPase DotB [Francisellaceae bacterium]MBT6538274.1 Dot/Icm type IV secretion system ATPase DotB [Francisellaceae bacterium]
MTENSSILLSDEPVRFNSEAFDRMLIHCVNLSASDVTLQSNSPIIAEVHGRLEHITTRTLSNTEVGDMLNTIYGANGTTQIYGGADVDTHYELRPSRNTRLRFRVNGTGCQVDGHDGIQITMRTIPSTPPDISTMNVEQEILENMAPAIGTVVVTGATGSGKSTLLASIIRHLLEQEDGHRKMVTYEAPIEFVYDSVVAPTSIMSQSEIPRHLPSFAAGVRNALRRKPRLILVGEARDQETIAAVIDAALTGHPVYTTVHSNGVSDAVRRMVSTFPANERSGRALDILETMRLVVWQKLCPSTDGKRIALKEFLVFDEEVRDILIATPVDKLASKTRELLKERGQPMIVDARKKYEEGLLEEREFQLLENRAKIMDED